MSNLLHVRGAEAPPAGRLFALCLVLSIALHVAVLACVALAPRPDAVILEQVLSVELAPETTRESALPLPVALPAVRKPPAERKPAVAATTRAQSAPAVPPLAPVETRAATESSAPAAAPAKAAEAPAGAAPAPLRSEPAPASAVPPSFNAAYLSNPRPTYPRQAQRSGEEGTVLLRVLVTREGLPARIELDKTSGSAALDGAALQAVKVWRFVPARKAGEAVEEWVRVPILFRLVDAS